MHNKTRSTPLTDLSKIAPFFSGWEETFLWSCLQGCMGYAIADDAEHPTAAQIAVGDICFFAGKPNDALAAEAAAPIIVPRNEQWSKVIEAVWGGRVEKTLRYAMKKEPDVFDVEKLAAYANSLEQGYILKLFDEATYHKAMREEWSKDLCSQFADYADYSKRGIGVAALQEGKLVSGASSYIVYHGNRN